MPYGTECGPGCRCRARSPLLYGTAPYYGTGARADARIRTSVRICVSILKPGTASFLKLKSKKKHTWVHLKVARAHFSSKISCLKFFLKLLCVTRTRFRILGSGSVKKSIKTEKAYDSGSGRGPDPRIVPKLKANASGSGFLNPDSGLFYADPRFASDLYSTVRIHSSGSNWALLMCL